MDETSSRSIRGKILKNVSRDWIEKKKKKEKPEKQQPSD